MVFELLLFLGRELGISPAYGDALQDLTKKYYRSRSPDAIEDVPYKIYTKQSAINDVEIYEKIL